MERGQRFDRRDDASNEQTDSAVYVHDFAGRFLDANVAALSLLGYALEDVTSLEFASLLDEQQVPLAMATAAELHTTGEQKRPTEFRLRRKDGSWIWVETMATVVYENGEPVAVRSTARDITARKRAESGDEVVCAGSAIDARLRVLIVEDMEADAMLAAEELRDAGHDIEWERVDTAPGLRNALCRARWDLVLSDHNMPGFDGLQALRIVREHDSGVPFIMVSGTIGEENAANVIRAGAAQLVLKHDLAQLAPAVERALREAEAHRARSVAEKRLRESEERYRALAEASNDVIFVVDEDDCLQYVNNAGERLSGRPASTLLGTPLSELFPGESVVDAVRSTKTPQYLETDHADHLGRRWFGTWFVPLLQDEKVSGVMGVARDITEQRQTQESLRQSNALMQHLFDSAPTVIYALEPLGLAGKGRWVGANVQRLLGYSVEEALASGWWVANLHPDDRETTLAGLDRLLADGNLRHEYRFRRKDGRYIWVQDELVLYRDANGSPMEIIGTWADITARKEAEQSLAASNLALRLLSEVNKVALRTEDEQGLMREVCRLIVENGRYALAWIGKAITGAEKRVEPIVWEGAAAEYVKTVSVRWDESPLGMSPAGIAVRTGRMVEVANLGEDPRFDPWREQVARFGLRCSIALPLHGHGDIVWGVLSIYKTEATGFRSEEAAILDELAAALCAGVEYHRARAAAKRNLKALEERKTRLEILNAVAFAELEGTPPETLIPQTVAHLAAKLRGVRVAFACIEEDGSLAVSHAAGPEGPELGRRPRLAVTPEQMRILTGGQPTRTTSTLGFPLCSRGALQGALLMDAVEPRTWTSHEAETIRDVAYQLGNALAKDESERQRERAQRHFQHSQRMEAVGRLAGGVAHDFNNLLAVISSNAEMVLEELPDIGQEREDVTEIQKAAQKAAKLTQQLLAFSRKQVLEPSELDINSVVTDMEKMLGRIIGEDIRLVTRTSDVKQVYVDRGQMEQVLMNLAVNARDAMPIGGTLTIETADIELQEAEAHAHPHAKPGCFVRLSVRDTGVGMTDEVCEQIFEPFFTTKDVGRGTGLGLATIDGIVEQSGGYILVDSEVGVGSTFHVHLPAHEPTGTEVRHVSVRAPALGANERILVVEDDGAVRRALRRILKSAGYRVETASNGEEALSLFETPDYAVDLVLTDVIMPGMGGPELARRLAERAPDVKILFMSGYMVDQSGPWAALQAPVHFLRKPFSKPIVMQKVREALDAYDTTATGDDA